MKRSKLFVENMVVYGLGGIVSKAIPLVMVPIVTRLLPDTAYYGLSDLCSTITKFGCALAVMGMYDAMFRMFFERENDYDYQKGICSTAFSFTLILSILISVLIILNREKIASFVFHDTQYTYLVIIAAIGAALTGTNSIVGAPTRIQNKRKTYLCIQVILPLLSYSIAIPLILNGHYIIALPVSIIIADLVVSITYIILNHKWFSLKKFNKDLLKPLLIISVPAAPVFLIYWVFNSSDKIMITNFIGAAQAGIYTAGSKIGQCSQLIYLAFSGGWSYFAFKTMKDKDQVETRAKVLEYLGVISFVSAIIVFSICKPLCAILFDGDYEKGFIVAPYLFMAPLMQMLFQVNANQFTIRKQTWITTLILLTGAIINVGLNWLMIPKLGIEGAAIASLIGYLSSTIIAIHILLRMKLIVLSKRFLLSFMITFIYILLWRFVMIDNTVLSVSVALLMIAFFSCLYWKDLHLIVRSLLSRK